MTPLRRTLRRVRRRLLTVGAASAAVWGLAVATMLLLLGAWLDLLWEFPAEWRIATLWAAAAGGATLLIALAALTLRAAHDAAVAQRLDRAGNCGGRVLTGWELALGRYGLSGMQPAPLSAGLADLAVDEAAVVARTVPSGRAAPLRPLSHALATLAVLWAVAGILAVGLPGLAWTQWSRFLRPFDDIPPFSLSTFDVTPGDVQVLYGSELEIRAVVRGAPVDQLELVLASARGQEPPLPMFPEAGGAWRAVLAKVVEPADYCVRAYRARSQKYHIDVITVPLIESARLRIVPPEYANRAPYEGPLPKEGVSGLPGTKVEVFLRSNRPLSGGTMALWRNNPGTASAAGMPAPQADRTALSMRPTESGSQEAVGQFTVAGDGKFECRVIDEDGQTSQQSFSGNITMLHDERPFLRLLQPPKTSLATPSATLPVVLSAEDDCGISRLQLFRSLNDSRPLPADLPVPSRSPRRLDESVRLPLAEYGLQPGDVIKLFGRVEDNDPAGAKGAESSVATVRIVSQEDFERMFRARQGMQVMLSKYYEARRRMESLAKQIDELSQELEKLPPGETASEEMRRELERLRESMRLEAGEIRKAAAHPLPYDLDKYLTPQLTRLAEMSEGMAEELGTLLEERGVLNEKLHGKLDELAKRLSGGRQQFEERAAKPIEYFEAVFPLLADQERFIMLAQWQQDLAQRLASLKGRDGEDNPALKARIRELEQEQRQIHESLPKLLEDIEDHSEKLPDRPELAELRRTAKEFVEAVLASGALEAMAAAEASLAEFAPTPAHKKAQEAAEILDKLIARCKGMAGSAEGALVFQPSLSSGLGNTVAQLLAEMNMGGNGGMGGYSMIGLYGGLPEMFGGKEGQMSDSAAGWMGRGTGRGLKPQGENPDAANAGETFTPGAAAGAGEGAVPVRYRRQVGQYFQRIAEETGEGGR